MLDKRSSHPNHARPCDSAVLARKASDSCARIDFNVPTPEDETRFMAPVTAKALPPRYERLGELGRGGMGIVYKVRDRETGEVVALKILKPEIAGNPQILERFKDELLLAHKITHRYVARLYEFHREGDAVYLSMEYVEGESLRSLLEREGRFTTERAIEFARNWRKASPRRIANPSCIAI